MVCLWVVILAGCGKQAEPGVSDATPVSEATPAVAEAALPPAPPEAPKEPRLAPEGVFYLVRKVSVTTDSGISSAHPGTRVTLVREEDGKMIVHDGRMEFAVQQDFLTNDLDEAEALVVRPVAAVRSQPKPNASTQAVAAQQAIPEPADSARPIGLVNSAKIQALQSQIDALGVKIQADQAALTQIESDEEARRDYRMRFGRFPQNAVGIKQSKYEVQQRLSALQRQQRALILQQNSLSQ